MKIGEYGESVIDFGSSDRVELHPALDLWAQGARYGNVLPARPYYKTTMVRVDVDNVGVRYFAPYDLKKL
jgi:hypothetical protein